MAKRIIRVRRRKKKQKRRIALTLFLLFAMTIGGIFYYVSQVYTASYEDLDRGNKSDLREEAVDIGDEPISILLLGVEDYSSDGQAGRADTQIVLTIDPETQDMTMTSIPRDLKVDIPASKVGEKYGGSHKINAAYTIGEISGYGAEKLTIETVEDYLDIPIDKYASVNFEGFAEIVDVLGGVTVDVKQGFWERSHLQHDKRIEFTEGETKMDGEEALAFVRMRKRDVAIEYPRDERQRQFIKASIEEALSPGNIFKADELADAVSSNVQTNLSVKEAFALQKAFSSKDPSTETFTLEGQNTRLEDGLFYFVPYDGSVSELSNKIRTALKINEEPSEESSYSSSASKQDTQESN
ncbi:LCP family protein [Halobacillus litoralis]|nr:LCP family protein [Halobacillus litoralis]